MKLTWMPPRRFRYEDHIYPKIVHWLVDHEGRILATVIEPRENEEESFDVRLYYTSVDDAAYFISLEHAQAWAEKRTRADRAKKPNPQEEAVAGVVASVPQTTD